MADGGRHAEAVAGGRRTAPPNPRGRLPSAGHRFGEVQDDEITYDMYMEEDIADEALQTASGQELVWHLRHYVFYVCTLGGSACNFTFDANPHRYNSDARSSTNQFHALRMLHERATAAKLAVKLDLATRAVREVSADVFLAMANWYNILDPSDGPPLDLSKITVRYAAYRAAREFHLAMVNIDRLEAQDVAVAAAPIAASNPIPMPALPAPNPMPMVNIQPVEAEGEAAGPSGTAPGHGAPAAAVHPAPLRQCTLIQFFGRPIKRLKRRPPPHAF